MGSSGRSQERSTSKVGPSARPDPQQAEAGAGGVDGRVSFRGTLRPISCSRTSDGRVAIRDAIVESIPLGEVAAIWATRGDEVVVREFRARPFSGSLTGHHDPHRIGRARVEATLDIRTDQFADLHGGRFSGTAELDATIATDPKALAIDLTLQAPDLTLQGVLAGFGGDPGQRRSHRV